MAFRNAEPGDYQYAHFIVPALQTLDVEDLDVEELSILVQILWRMTLLTSVSSVRPCVAPFGGLYQFGRCQKLRLPSCPCQISGVQARRRRQAEFPIVQEAIYSSGVL